MVELNVATHQEEKNEGKKTGKTKAEDRQPILKKLRPALLRWFRGQTAKKWFVRGECPR